MFLLWSKIGVKSVGGGQAVQFYAFEHMVTELKWLTYDEWVQLWGLSQIVPGVNVIAVCALTGLRVAGMAGSVAALAGLMAPSVAATILISAAYTQIAQLAGVHAALRGMFAAVVGAALVLNWRVGRPIVKAARARSRIALTASVAIPVVAGTVVAEQWVPVVYVLLGSAALMSALWIQKPR
ncbi:MAG TPA: chromate transporter [Acidothermaceae bacterium]